MSFNLLRSGLRVLVENYNNPLLTPLFARLFIPFGLGYFISVLLGSANAIMSPILIDTFSLSPANLGFMTSVYLISFGLAQFPVGVLLDRYGARMTLAPLLLFASAGAIVFALAGNIEHLIISRALVGIGMSGCLMASFKAYADWLPKERLPLVYSIESLTGGIGGVFATRPIAIAFESMSWRSCFLMLAVFTMLISASIWFIAPKDKSLKLEKDMPFRKSLVNMITFLCDSRFWLVTPVVTASQSVMFAYLYLWIGPWMRDVAVMKNSETGAFMMYAFTGAAAGYFLNGVLADFLHKKNLLSWEKLYLCSGVLLTLFLALIAFINGRNAASLWGIVMFLSTMTMISFPIMRTLYKSEEVGRALSLLNFAIFFMSFIFQWFIGLVLNFYPVTGGCFSPAGYQSSLYIISAVNLIADIHLYLGLRRTGKI